MVFQQIHNKQIVIGRDTYMHLATFFKKYFFWILGTKQKTKSSLQRKIESKRETKKHTLLLLAPMMVEISFVFMHLAPWLLTTVAFYHSLQ